MATLDEILGKIESQTKLGKEELREKIKRKQNDLSGLVSLEGAAYLVAKEVGVNLLNSERRKLELRNILAGMRSVSAAGRVFKISRIVDFKKRNGSDGRVVNLFIGDSTGFVRMPLWNDHVVMVEDEIIKLGDIIQISGAFASENIYGDIELSIGKYGSVFNINDEAFGADIEFPTVDELSKAFLGPRTDRVPIKNISPGSFEIRATIIDVVRSRFLFNTCPHCGGKAEEMENGSFECKEHGEVKAEPAMVVSFIADDGTGALRVVAFRDTAEKLTTTTAGELSRLDADERYRLLSGTVVGKEYIIYGRVKKNKQFDRLEMVASSVQNLNISEESEKLAGLLKMKLG